MESQVIIDHQQEIQKLHQLQKNGIMFTKNDTESKQTFLLKKSRNILKNPYQLILTKLNLKITHASFEKIAQQLIQMKQLTIEYLDLAFNNSPLTSKILYTVDFSNLRYLYLCMYFNKNIEDKTEIASIEFLSGMNTEKLKILTLGMLFLSIDKDENYIISVKPLVKIQSKELKILSLSDMIEANPTLQINALPRVYFAEQVQTSYLISRKFASVYSQFSKIMALNFDIILDLMSQIDDQNDLAQDYGLKLANRLSIG